MELRRQELEEERDACVETLQRCQDEAYRCRLRRRISDIDDQIEVLDFARNRRVTAPYPVIHERFVPA